MSTKPIGQNLYNKNITFVPHFYALSLAVKIIVYTPVEGIKKKKYLNHIFYTRKMPNLAGSNHLSAHFFRHRPRFFHLSTEKVRV